MPAALEADTRGRHVLPSFYQVQTGRRIVGERAERKPAGG
jgi:hypothetical protein